MLEINGNYKVNPKKQTTADATKSASQPSFTGHKVVEDEFGARKYRFYLPVGTDSKVKLEVVPLYKDEKGNFVPDKSDVLVNKEELPKDKRYLEYSFDELGLSKDDPSVAVGYKFVIDGKEYLDNALKTQDGSYNIAVNPERPVLTAPRHMYHLMPDNFNPDTTKAGVKDSRRTHFNKFDGTLKGIIDKVNDLKDFGASRIMSTPVFGQDNISTHGYWTTNPYQITKSQGSVSDFKKLQVELFKKGMGWVADGAFVNEGLEGIHLMDIAKWGKKSPYIDWVETHGFEDQPLKFGILPKKEEAAKNFAVRIVNSPVKEFSISGKQYDPAKPTFVQLYDKRMVSDEQLATDEPIRSYDKKAVEDANSVNNYMDAVWPYSIKVDPKEVKNVFQNTKKELAEGEDPTKHLLKWNNFAFVRSDEDGGSTLWVGNKDISKLRFMINDDKKKEVLKSYHNKEDGLKRLENIDRSINQVQDSIVQVGQFWTKEVANTLTEHTAREIAKHLNSSKGDYSKAISKAVKEGEVTPKAEGLQGSIKNVLNGSYLNETPVVQSVTEGLMSYPFDAIEFDSGLSSVFASPFIKKLASTKEEIGLSRHEYLQKDNSYEQVPQEFRPVYEKMDRVIRSKMTAVATDILKEMDKTGRVGSNLLNNEGQLTDEGKQIYGLIASDIAKYTVVKSLAPNVDPDFSDKTSLNYDLENKPAGKLADVSVESLCLNGNSPEDVADNLVNRISTGIASISDVDKSRFAGYLADRLEGVDANTVKVAKLITDKTESGLEWRIDAAKDIADLDSVSAGKANFADSWEEVIGFWSKFNQGVRQYNPKAYMIGEVTEVPGFFSSGPQGRFQNAGDAELKFIQETGFTTQTNYNYLYSTPHELAGSNTEAVAHSGIEKLNEKLIHAWAGTPGMLFSGPADNVNYSHVGMGNHDKPRTLHGFALDMDIFHSKVNSPKVQNAMKEFYNGYEQSKLVDDIESIQGDIKKGEQNAVKSVLASTPLKIVAALDASIKDGWYADKSLGQKLEWMANERFQPGSGEEGNDDSKLKSSWLFNTVGLDKHISVEDYKSELAQLKDKYGVKTAPEAYKKLAEEYNGKISEYRTSDEYNQKLEAIADKSAQFDSKAIAMGKVLSEEFNNSLAALPEQDAKTIKAPVEKAIRSFTIGDRAEYFGVRPIDHNIDDVFKAAKDASPEFSTYADTHKDTINKLKVDMHKRILEPAMKKYKASMSMLVALPGNPTNYAGDELGETGFELKAKNAYVQNRNRLHWERADKSSDEYRGYIDNFRNEVKGIMSLRNQKHLSPLTNGSTVVLKHQDTKVPVFGIFRYNEDSDVIALFNNEGFGVSRKDAGKDEVALGTTSIDLGQGSLEHNGTKYSLGLPTGLKEGTVYKNAFDEKDTYEIKDGKLVKQGDDKEIKIKGSTLLLYRAKKYDGASNEPSFSGKVKNPNVALANMKFNLPAYRTGTKPVEQQPNKILTTI